MKMALDATRALLGNSLPRTFSGDKNEKLALYPPPPTWAARDELQSIIAWRERLLLRGRVVLCARIMANRTLYHITSTPSSSAMLVVWSADPFFEENADELAMVASEAGALKNTSPDENSDLAPIAALITDEMARTQNVPLPPSLTDGREVFLSSLIAWRAHLPMGFLSGTFMPLLVLPEETPAALIVPGRFWSDDFKDR